MSMMSSFKGFLGESVINIATWLKLEKESYHRLNNITLPLDNGGSTQIDHVIVSKYGIFVIETKNYKGWIYGNEKQSQWTQAFPNGSKYKFQNPLRQNYLHIKTLAELLELEMSYFHSMIAFIGECELKTRDELPAHVLKGGIVSYIKSKQDEILSETEVLSIVEQIETKRFTKSWRTNRAHKAYLKDKHAPKANKPDSKPDNKVILNQEQKPAEPDKQVKIKAPAKQYEQWSGQVKQDDVLSMPFTSKNAVFMTPFEVLDSESSEIKIKISEPAKASSPIDRSTSSKKVDDIASITSEPSCPKCHSEMIQRIAKKGARQGQTFYGCSQFPKCRGVVNSVS